LKKAFTDATSLPSGDLDRANKQATSVSFFLECSFTIEFGLFTSTTLEDRTQEAGILVGAIQSASMIKFF
jgi:hypothetical protein